MLCCDCCCIGSQGSCQISETGTPPAVSDPTSPGRNLYATSCRLYKLILPESYACRQEKQCHIARILEIVESQESIRYHMPRFNQFCFPTQPFVPHCSVVPQSNHYGHQETPVEDSTSRPLSIRLKRIGIQSPL